MYMGNPFSSAGHFALIAGRTLFTMKSRLTSMVTDVMAFVTRVPTDESPKNSYFYKRLIIHARKKNYF
jgi:hypothetical protein